MKRIRNTSKQPPLIAPAAVAKALGGEIVAGQVRMADLAQGGKGALTHREVDDIRRWLAERWEAADVDEQLVAVIGRLLATIQQRDVGVKRLQDVCNMRADGCDDCSVCRAERWLREATKGGYLP